GLWGAARRPCRSAGRDQPVPNPGSRGTQRIIACLRNEALIAEVKRPQEASGSLSKRPHPLVGAPEISNHLEMSCDASAECLNVRPHGALRSVGIMVADGGKNGFMLLLKAAVVVRRGK